MKEFPTIERSIWSKPEPASFESAIAMRGQLSESILDLIDAPAYFERIGSSKPVDGSEILKVLETNELIVPADNEWNITNLGAILLANRLEDFHALKRKSLRLIRYQGRSRADSQQQLTMSGGYASGFEETMNSVTALLPLKSSAAAKTDEDASAWAQIAMRELIVNAMVHQDFSKPDAGPLIEIFDDRIEVSNRGLPLIDAERVVNAPPKTRNQNITSLMCQMGLSAESGCGWDRIISEAERHKMPAPRLETDGDSTRVVLFEPKPLSDLDHTNRIWSVYMHACLKVANHENLTNGSLRARFGIELKNSAIASRLIKEAVEANVIVPYQAEIGRKHMSYVPYWAVSSQSDFI